MDGALTFGEQNMASVKRITVRTYPTKKAKAEGAEAWAEVEKLVEEDGWSVVTAVPISAMGSTQGFEVILQKS